MYPAAKRGRSHYDVTHNFQVTSLEGLLVTGRGHELKYSTACAVSIDYYAEHCEFDCISKQASPWTSGEKKRATVLFDCYNIQPSIVVFICQ